MAFNVGLIAAGIVAMIAGGLLLAFGGWIAAIGLLFVLGGIGLAAYSILTIGGPSQGWR